MWEEDGGVKWNSRMQVMGWQGKGEKGRVLMERGEVIQKKKEGGQNSNKDVWTKPPEPNQTPCSSLCSTDSSAGQSRLVDSCCSVHSCLRWPGEVWASIRPCFLLLLHSLKNFSFLHSTVSCCSVHRARFHTVARNRKWCRRNRLGRAAVHGVFPRNLMWHTTCRYAG